MATATPTTTITSDQSFLARHWRELIRPRSLEVEERSSSYGKFVCEPLERGFGITLGNALRRVLLSSLQGAAVSAVKIEGALHEFTTLPDIVEDVTDIILNIKGILVRMSSAKPRVVRLDKEIEGDAVAGDITLVDGVEILNPQHHIATISRGGKLHVELHLGVGRGYVPAERNKSLNMAVGTIPVDSLFSPVKKVNYTVTNARVGQQTDYDKLTLEVWTTGVVRPEDAVAFAAKIVKEQISIFINFEEQPEPIETPVNEELEKLNENLWRTVDELELSVRSANCLQNANIK
ncbi:MAG: DNA-directed RNA polymerase subunit alpha, partial [Pseudomonadota bacterium]